MCLSLCLCVGGWGGGVGGTLFQLPSALSVSVCVWVGECSGPSATSSCSACLCWRSLCGTVHCVCLCLCHNHSISDGAAFSALSYWRGVVAAVSGVTQSLAPQRQGTVLCGDRPYCLMHCGLLQQLQLLEAVAAAAVVPPAVSGAVNAIRAQASHVESLGAPKLLRSARFLESSRSDSQVIAIPCARL